MTAKATYDPAGLQSYILDNSLRDDSLLKELREETAKDPASNMQIAPEQGQFMALLAKSINAKRIIEIGTFTGYSSLCFARALPEDGYLLCCDVDDHWTSIAKRYWQRAKVDHKIELKLAPAKDTLDALLNNGQHNSFDLAFIDADKESYDNYYEQCLALIRPNGLILLDNMLWDGKVADKSVNDANTKAIRALNKKLLSDTRVDVSLIAVADGISLVRKR